MPRLCFEKALQEDAFVLTVHHNCWAHNPEIVPVHAGLDVEVTRCCCAVVGRQHCCEQLQDWISNNTNTQWWFLLPYLLAGKYSSNCAQSGAYAMPAALCCWITSAGCQSVLLVC